MACDISLLHSLEEVESSEGVMRLALFERWQ